MLREYVMLVVRDYNAILDTLARDERLLFHEHIRRLDRRINGGLTRFTWASKTVIEWYEIGLYHSQCTRTSPVVGSENMFTL